jgi:hypothetical protein
VSLNIIGVVKTWILHDRTFRFHPLYSCLKIQKYADVLAKAAAGPDITRG